MTEIGLDKKAVIAALTKSTHGELKAYVQAGLSAAMLDPEFYGHLMAWNHQKGAIRDAKVAVPTVALLAPHTYSVPVLLENALAHLADLSPRLLLQAYNFGRDVKVPHRLLRRLITRYLRDLEADRRGWERTALQHRESMRTLYGRLHLTPGGGAKDAPSDMNMALMRGAAEHGKFAIVRQLASLPDADIAVALRKHHLPFLVARGALGARAKEPAVAMALIQSMTATELVTNMKALERLGVKSVPELRAALEQALEKAGKRPGRQSGQLKAHKAATVLEAEGEDKLAGKLHALQERQITQARQLAGVNGDWAVLGDCSGSMSHAIEVARQVAGALTRAVQGKVYLVFFNTGPRFHDVTGKTYEEIAKLTQLQSAGGGTSIGCGLQYIREKKLAVDGIAIISDGGHNNPPSFTDEYARYTRDTGAEPTVYFYQTPGDRDALSAECRAAGVQLEHYDLRTGPIDRESLPGIVQTMRVGRYALLDEIMDTPLATLDEVLERTKGMRVWSDGTAGLVTA